MFASVFWVKNNNKEKKHSFQQQKNKNKKKKTSGLLKTQVKDIVNWKPFISSNVWW